MNNGRPEATRVRGLAYRLRRCPFTLLGIGTLILWLLAVAGIFFPTGAAFRVVIIPVHLTRVLIVGVELLIWQRNAPRVLDMITVPLLLTPYVLLDLLVRWLWNFRRSRQEQPTRTP